MYSHHLTATLAQARIDSLLAEADHHRLVTEARRRSRSQQAESFGNRRRWHWFPRLATA